VTQPPAEGDVEAAVGYSQQSLLPPATTGDARVDTALRGLDELGQRPVHEHVATFEQVHAAFSEALADLEPALTLPPA